MLNFLILVVLVSLATSFVVCFVTKFPKPIKNDSIRDLVIMYAPKLVSEAFECDFCLCFWVSLVISVTLFSLTMNAWILLTPIFSTTLARLLV